MSNAAELRMHGVEVNETPNYLAKNPTEETFAMTINEVSIAIGDESLIVPFQLQGALPISPYESPVERSMKMIPSQRLI
jgi:Zn finger protein HypA/HybF involved in hydrogenase expression